MLRPSVRFPRAAECTDAPKGPQALAFFAQDVPWRSPGRTGSRSADGARPRTRPAATARPSSPCWTRTCSPPRSPCPATSTRCGTARRGVVGRLTGAEEPQQPGVAPPVSLLVTTAKDEAGSSGYADSRRFLVLAHTAGAPLRVDSLILDHGGHNFSTWNVELPPRALSWLTQRLPGPAPVG